MSKIKSFRALMSHNSIDKVYLETIDGTTGYRIKKFELFPEKPGVNNSESLFQIFSIEASANAQVGAVKVNFSDNTLLGVGYVGSSTDQRLETAHHIVFDNIIFNQDIFIVYTDESTNNRPANYHLELEQVKLDTNETVMATLKDMRNTSTT